jgi:hypothetical protein
MVNHTQQLEPHRHLQQDKSHQIKIKPNLETDVLSVHYQFTIDVALKSHKET